LAGRPSFASQSWTEPFIPTAWSSELTSPYWGAIANSFASYLSEERVVDGAHGLRDRNSGIRLMKLVQADPIHPERAQTLLAMAADGFRSPVDRERSVATVMPPLRRDQDQLLSVEAAQRRTDQLFCIRVLIRCCVDERRVDHGHPALDRREHHPNRVSLVQRIVVECPGGSPEHDAADRPAPDHDPAHLTGIDTFQRV
jgi:hypothetical protein